MPTRSLFSSCRRNAVHDTTQVIDVSKLKYNPDEQWANLHLEKTKNKLYEWVGWKEGGKLLDIYTSEGEEGVGRFFDENIVPFLYNEGLKPEPISLNDYKRWKATTDKGKNAKEGHEVATDYFYNHDAVWKLNKRGVDGESLLHLLFARDEPLCTEIAKILLKICPSLAVDIYENEAKFGQSCLHLAILHEDLVSIELLLESKADPVQRTTGAFFHPESVNAVPAGFEEEISYTGVTYFGEYPLSLAATKGLKDVYDVLIKRGANPNAQDNYGNTVLHICIINNSIDMYSYAVRHRGGQANVNIANHDGYTPLTLACKLGRNEIFSEMLELMKVNFWQFSDVSCSAYPLTVVDTILSDGSTNWDSALMIIANGETEAHLDMIQNEVIQRLLADKWKSYARGKLIERFIALVLHLAAISVMVYMDGEPQTVPYYGKQVARIVTMLGCCYFILGPQLSEIRSQGFSRFLRNMVSAPSKALFLLANVTIIVGTPIQVLQDVLGIKGLGIVITVLETISFPCSWGFLLFFARSTMLTGPFIQMIYLMLKGDLIRFLMISSIFLTMFSQVFHFVLKQLPEITTDGPANYRNIIETVLTLFRASMGGFNYEEFECAYYSMLMKFIFILYMVVMPLMLINMLIAMMGNTYTTVIQQAEKAWARQKAQIVIVLERALEKNKLRKYYEEYTIPLEQDRGSEKELNENMEQTAHRGLVVLKRVKLTKALRRKRAINHWQQLCFVIKDEIRAQGLEYVQKIAHNSWISAFAPSNTAAIQERFRGYQASAHELSVGQPSGRLSARPVSRRRLMSKPSTPTVLVHRREGTPDKFFVPKERRSVDSNKLHEEIEIVQSFSPHRDSEGVKRQKK